MQRYFVEFNSNDQYVKITGEDYHHIKNVMRMKISDEIYVVNGNAAYYASIKSFEIDGVIVEILYEVKKESELLVKVTIAQGMPKLDKFETVIQKATELGVYSIIPILSERSLVKVDDKTASKKLERFEKIAKSAAEQSHRLVIPQIHNFMSVKEMLKFSESFNYKCLAYEASTKEEQYNFSRILTNMKQGESIFIFIGPEGGISDKELQILKENRFEVISLGNRILRTETAPLFVMAAIAYELELRG